MSCVEVSETRIDSVVQNVFIHIFLPNPQNTFPILQTTDEMESSRSFRQMIMTTSLNMSETLVHLQFL